MSPQDELLATAKNAAAVIGAIYEWLERVEKAGGATSIEGVSACHAMLKSLRKNAPRTEALVLVPLRAAIAKAEASYDQTHRDDHDGRARNDRASPETILTRPANTSHPKR